VFHDYRLFMQTIYIVIKTIFNVCLTRVRYRAHTALMNLAALYDPSQGEAKYLSIANAIERGIEEGVLTPTEPLPTHRSLAEALGVTVGTVTRGYAEAAQRGLIVGITGRGTFVISKRPDVDVKSADDRNCINLGFISPFEYFNPSLPDAVQRLGMGCRLDDLSSYQQPGGLMRHREAGCLWAQRYGLNVAPERLLICAGAQHALLTILASLFNPGDKIAAEQLSYPLLKQLAKRLRLHIVPVRMDRGGMLPEALEAACRNGDIKGLYLMPTCHNPTLAQIPEWRRHELVAICRRHDVQIIEDDVYALTQEHCLPPFATLAPERSCFIAATSEALSGGLRIAYLCPPEHYLAELERTISYTISMAPPLMAELAAMWINDGTADKVLAAKKAEARARNVLARGILDGFALETRTTGFFCWLKLPEPWTSTAFVDALKARKVLAAEGEHFLFGHSAPEQGVRLALGGTPSRAALEQALGVVADVLHQG
jgi:DNA-binding transcriptional MocR family regulator